MSKLGPEGEARQGINLLDAAKAAGVRHFIQSLLATPCAAIAEEQAD